MIEKEFVLVSQGIEIMRTKSQEKAINIVKKENDEYFDYQQKCYDNYERPADNYIDLEIEYSDEKEKDKEIEKLHSIIREAREYIEHENFKRNILVGVSTKKYTRDILNNILEILDKANDREDK